MVCGLYEEVVVGRAEALGDGHPDTLKAMDALLDLLEATGERPGAELLAQREVVRHKSVVRTKSASISVAMATAPPQGPYEN